MLRKFVMYGLLCRRGVHPSGSEPCKNLCVRLIKSGWRGQVFQLLLPACLEFYKVLFFNLVGCLLGVGYRLSAGG